MDRGRARSGRRLAGERRDEPSAERGQETEIGEGGGHPERLPGHRHVRGGEPDDVMSDILSTGRTVPMSSVMNQPPAGCRRCPDRALPW